MAKRLIGKILSELGTSGAVDACMSAILPLAAVNSAPEAAASIGAMTGVAAMFVGVAGAGSLLEWAQEKKTRSEFRAKFRDVHKALGKIKDAQQNCDDWEGLVKELLAGHLDRLEGSDPAQLIEQMRSAFEQQGITITTEINAGFDVMCNQLTAIEGKVDVAIEGMDRIESALSKIADTQAALIELSQSNAQLATANANLVSENTSLIWATSAASSSIARMFPKRASYGIGRGICSPRSACRTWSSGCRAGSTRTARASRSGRGGSGSNEPLPEDYAPSL